MLLADDRLVHAARAFDHITVRPFGAGPGVTVTAALQALTLAALVILGVALVVAGAPNWVGYVVPSLLAVGRYAHHLAVYWPGTTQESPNLLTRARDRYVGWWLGRPVPQVLDDARGISSVRTWLRWRLAVTQAGLDPADPQAQAAHGGLLVRLVEAISVATAARGTSAHRRKHRCTKDLVGPPPWRSRERSGGTVSANAPLWRLAVALSARAGHGVGHGVAHGVGHGGPQGNRDEWILDDAGPGAGLDLRTVHDAQIQALRLGWCPCEVTGWVVATMYGAVPARSSVPADLFGALLRGSGTSPEPIYLHTYLRTTSDRERDTIGRWAAAEAGDWLAHAAGTTPHDAARAPREAVVTLAMLRCGSLLGRAFPGLLAAVDSGRPTPGAQGC